MQIYAATQQRFQAFYRIRRIAPIDQDYRQACIRVHFAISLNCSCAFWPALQQRSMFPSVAWKAF